MNLVDTIKIRLQTTTMQRQNQKSLSSILNRLVFPHTNNKNYLQAYISLYRGLPVTLLFTVPALSVYLSCYEWTKQLLHKKMGIERDSAWSHLVSGCGAEVAAGTVFTPMEVMKNRLQTQKKHANVKASALASQILRQEGIRGFFKGYGMSLVVFVPHSMAYFVTYEKLKHWLIQQDTTTSKTGLYMLCSSIAGVAALSFSTPLEIIKTRWQISAAEQGKEFRQGPLSIAKKILVHEGPSVFLRSFLGNIAWGIPTTAISMTVFELLKDNRGTFNR